MGLTQSYREQARSHRIEVRLAENLYSVLFKIVHCQPAICSVVQSGCSFSFINERSFLKDKRKNQQDHELVISGTAFAFRLGSLDSK
jgi:hypothetical protein